MSTDPEFGERLRPVRFVVSPETASAYVDVTGHPEDGSCPPLLASVYTYGVIGQLASKKGAVLASQSFRFHGSVRVGDELTTSAQVSAAYRKRGRQYMEISLQTHNQRRDLVSDGVITRILPPGADDEEGEPA